MENNDVPTLLFRELVKFLEQLDFFAREQFIIESAHLLKSGSLAKNKRTRSPFPQPTENVPRSSDEPGDWIRSFNVNRASSGENTAALDSRGNVPKQFARLRVADTLQAYQDLARNYRTSLGLKVLAITGSNGKTTVTSLASALCRAAGLGAICGTIGVIVNHTPAAYALRHARDYLSWPICIFAGYQILGKSRSGLTLAYVLVIAGVLTATMYLTHFFENAEATLCARWATLSATVTCSTSG